MPGTRAAAGPAYAGGVPDKRIDGHHERLSSETGVVVVSSSYECRDGVVSERVVRSPDADGDMCRWSAVMSAARRRATGGAC